MISQISSWVLSICGVIFVGFFAEIILNQGKMKNFVKTSIAIVSILMVIGFIKNIDLSTIYNSLKSDYSSVMILEDVVDDINNKKIETLKNEIEKNLNNSGYQNCLVSFELDANNNILKVFVDLKKMVLDKNLANIDKYTNIIAIIKSFVSIKEENIIFYE